MINIYLIGNKGFIALKSLNESQLKFITCIIIGQDKNIQNDYSKEIEQLCNDKHIKYVIQNKTFSPSAQYSIAIGWRWLITDDSKLIVFHDSILPKYRGFNPLVTALINGDKKVGVTALIGSEEYDKGEIIDQEIIEISYPLKIKIAIDMIAECFAKLLQNIIDKIASQDLVSTPQNEALASYSIWRDEENYKIDWTKDSAFIKRFVDAVGYPYHGAHTYVKGQKIIIKDMEIVDDVSISNREPGKAIFKDKSSFTVICGKGLVKINEFYDEKGHSIRFDNFRLRFK